MKNNNFLLRTLTCVVGIPLLAAVIFLLPQYNFIGVRILITLCALLGSLEMSKITFSKSNALSYLTWLMPFSCIFKEEYAELLLVVFIAIVFATEIKTGEKDDFEQSISSVGKKILCILYPSYFLTFPIRFTSLPGVNSFMICYYILLVFSNDIFAYIFGMLFGKNNNAGLKASPKKSYAGFIGGFIGSIAISFIFTSIFTEKNLCFDNYLFVILCPVLLSVLADIGDLVESVFKRCAKVKDSSHLIPGHGGALDRLDSIVITAPVFYFIVKEFIA